jgi:hypothetical protein
VSVAEQFRVDLHDSEKEGYADAEQQHAVHGLNGADHLKSGRHR